ncbi:hypothetical protein DL770_000656 [Monosporascus sp. CRB-9-2]|nr:hypothetical protein DL770_000656 [Monosporascus sp. CRB-9-2]
MTHAITLTVRRWSTFIPTTTVTPAPVTSKDIEDKTTTATAAFTPIQSVEGNPPTKRTVAAESSSRRTPARAAITCLPAALDARKAPIRTAKRTVTSTAAPSTVTITSTNTHTSTGTEVPVRASATATESTTETFTTTTTATAYAYSNFVNSHNRNNIKSIYFPTTIRDFGSLSTPDALGCCEVCQRTPGCGVFVRYDGNCLLPVPDTCSPVNVVGCYGTPDNNAVAGCIAGNGNCRRLWWDKAP